MNASEQQFCLRWHNYQTSLLASLPQMLDGDDLTDVTLSAGGASLRAHRVVLSACSGYFKELFKRLPPMQHPVVVLPGARFSELRALVTFMYSGEVNVFQAQLPGLLHMADALQIRGLAQVKPQEPLPLSGQTSPTLPMRHPSANKRPRRADSPEHGPVGLLQPKREEAVVQATELDPAIYGPFDGLSPHSISPRSPPTFHAAPSPPPNEMPAPSECGQSDRDAERLPSATCPVCGKRLSNPYNLRVHMDTHARAAHACASCPHVSRSRDALRKHVSYRHPTQPSAALQPNVEPSGQPRRRPKDVNNNAKAEPRAAAAAGSE